MCTCVRRIFLKLTVYVVLIIATILLVVLFFFLGVAFIFTSSLIHTYIHVMYMDMHIVHPLC